jgi:hypothetical protein
MFQKGVLLSEEPDRANIQFDANTYKSLRNVIQWGDDYCSQYVFAGSLLSVRRQKEFCFWTMNDDRNVHYRMGYW